MKFTINIKDFLSRFIPWMFKRGRYLDKWAFIYGIEREPFESNSELQDRMLSLVKREREGKPYYISND